MYFAHSNENGSLDSWQPLAEHLLAVGSLAKDFASTFDVGELARVSGLLHDLGKYTQEFQNRLHGSPTPVDHSTWGARLAIERFGASGAGRLIAYAIAGHHAGLANGKGEGRRSSLEERLSQPLAALHDAWQQEVELPAPAQLLLPKLKEHSRDRRMFQLSFLVRMLYSCLVDADYLDTEAFYDRVERRTPRRNAANRPDLTTLRSALDQHLSQFSSDKPINAIRSEILQHVRAQAVQAPGLFSLTVPTGGGKTLASLAFALDHAVRHGLQRVIFVIPFTSVVEQSAAVFRRALGQWGGSAVLEHHSAYADDTSHATEARDKINIAMDNWDAPIVVSTSVQFFESLFADRPAKCRKLHNIANCAIILDEAQSMPLKLLRPCVAALDELTRNYRSSVVLCTATQPALGAFADGLRNVRELAPDPPSLFERLQRVNVVHAGILEDENLLTQLRAKPQVLCIVNNRLHARTLYQGLEDMPGSYHLTTLMCAAHRSKVLASVRAALRDGKPCRLVSTSLIEAGVDVDFPLVYRAEAGLDSIAQAAGRCNREGLRLSADSQVLVFANDAWKPPAELSQFAGVAREALRNHQGNPLCPAAIELYFHLLYSQKGDVELDGPGLLALLTCSKPDSLPFDTVAQRFKMIESAQTPIIIPYDEAARQALDRLRFAQGAVGIGRDLQRYIVQIPQRGYMELLKAGAIAPVDAKRWGDQFVVLTNEHLYHAEFGLSWDNPSFIEASALVI